MKHHHLLLALSLAVLSIFSTSSARADSPEAILKDYRKQAAQAVERLNQSLEKAATPLISKLVKDGDTAGADELTKQLKDKLAGQAVLKPEASAANLFSLYDEARSKALAPIQKSSIARIESLLKTAGGAKLETVTELGKARKEIEGGKIVDPKAIPVEWTYHQTRDGRQDADIWMRPDGVFEINDGSGPQFGKWKPKHDGFEIQMEKYTWKVTVVDGVGTIVREVGTRYMKVKNKDAEP